MPVTSKEEASVVVDSGYTCSESMVLEFRHHFNLPVPSTPCKPEHIDTAVKLVLEELNEVIAAHKMESREAYFKELCDLQYVVDQLFCMSGMACDKEAGMVAVHQSNMSKLGDDGKPVLREDGKVLKGPNYKPVSLETLRGILNT
jgi:predicted HAD superfamily Cof-like phosphohydrolase